MRYVDKPLARPSLAAVFFFLLVQSLLIAPSAFANGHCANAFEKLAAQDPEFIRIAVRDPQVPLLDAAYPQRLHDSLHDIFLPWFKADPGSPKTDFVEMLRQAHRVLVTGKDGSAIYRGASRVEHNLASGYVVAPSILRHEFSPSPAPWGFSFRSDLYLSQNRGGEFADLVEQYRRNRAEGLPAEPTDKTVDAMPFPSSALQLIELPRVGRKIRTWNAFYENYVTHTYYGSDGVPAVLEAMGRAMEEIRELYHSPDRFSASGTTTLLRLLAEYVYLGAHSHMFPGANYSLVMGQANALLSLWNIRGISQSDLDYVAMARPFPIFEARFRADVAAINLEDGRDLLQPDSRTSLEAPTGPLHETTVLAHISNIGDRPFWGSEYIGVPDHAGPLEGMLVPAPRELPGGVQLSYRADLAGSGKTPWVPAGNFLGTRGESRAMLGVAFKLEGPGAENFVIRYQLRRRGGGDGPILQNGDENPVTGDDPVVGLNLWLERR